MTENLSPEAKTVLFALLDQCVLIAESEQGTEFLPAGEAKAIIRNRLFQFRNQIAERMDWPPLVYVG